MVAGPLIIKYIPKNKGHTISKKIMIFFKGRSLPSQSSFNPIGAIAQDIELKNQSLNQNKMHGSYIFARTESEWPLEAAEYQDFQLFLLITFFKRKIVVRRILEMFLKQLGNGIN